VDIQFRVFALNTINGLCFQPALKAVAREIVFFSSERSSAYRYKGGASLAFYEGTGSSSPIPGPTGEITSPPVALAMLPPGVKQVMLLFFPKRQPAADGLKYDVVVIEDSLEKVPLGMAVTLNASGQNYEGRVGTVPIQIPPGQGVPFKVVGRVHTQLAARVNGQAFRAATFDLKLNAQQRAWVLLFPPYAIGEFQPQIRVLYESQSSLRSSGQADSFVDLASAPTRE